MVQGRKVAKGEDYKEIFGYRERFSLIYTCGIKDLFHTMDFLTRAKDSHLCTLFDEMISAQPLLLIY